MTNLRHILEQKERLTRFLVRQSISLIDRSGSWSGGFLLIFYTLPLFMVLSILLRGSGYQVRYQLVEPGHYRPRQCSEWRFESGTERQLHEGLEQLALTAYALDLAILPGNQMGIPFCVIQLDGEQLLNPRITIFEGRSERFTVNPQGFCNSDSKLTLDLTPAITLNWINPETYTSHYRRFTNPIASELQVAILIQRGDPICH